MKIGIIGASGFIGSHLSDYLEKKGYKIARLSHSNVSVATLSPCNVVINLAGASVGKRWNHEHKIKMFKSRTVLTHTIVEILNVLPNKPRLFINASAVGIYASGCHDDWSTNYGDNFLARLSRAWEREVARTSTQIRTVTARFGVVLSPDGGAMPRILEPIKKIKTSVVVGDGKQNMAWIALEDLLKSIEFIIENDQIEGPVNIVAPIVTTNRDLTNALRHKFNGLLHISIPKWFLKILVGERVQIIANETCAIPKKLLDNNFTFKYPNIDSYIASL